MRFQDVGDGWWRRGRLVADALTVVADALGVVADALTVVADALGVVADALTVVADALGGAWCLSQKEGHEPAWRRRAADGGGGAMIPPSELGSAMIPLRAWLSSRATPIRADAGRSPPWRTVTTQRSRDSRRSGR
jgi:hypothetical protein